MKKKILWAIDPYETNIHLNPSFLTQLLGSAKAEEISIQPVYVLSTAPEEQGKPSYAPNISREEKNIGEYLRRLKIIGTAPCQVLTLQAAGRAEESKALHQYALESGSDCILVSSHGRAGVGRMLFGSFAENLLSVSSLPIFFLSDGEANSNRAKLEQVLFATDFSERSKVVFERFLKMAKLLCVSVDLFHVVSLPATALLSSQETQVVVSADFFTEQLEWAKQEGDKWKKLARAEGVDLSFDLLDNGIGADIAELLLAKAKEKKIDFIAMSSASSTLSSLVLGSLSVSLFRRNLFPCLVYGPKS